MGTMMAPPYANMFMGHLEKRYHEDILKLRFIDDVDIMKWLHGSENLNSFQQEAYKNLL